MERENHKTRVLVTGATGFLGRNILRALQQRSDVIPIAACRDAGKLTGEYTGEVREGDLLDVAYRREVVQGADVVCNAASWAAMWGNRPLEQSRFYRPTLALIDAALEAGVRRFIQTSTIAINEPGEKPLTDDAPARKTGFWPHLDMLIDVDNYMRARSGSGMQMVTMRLGHFVGPGNRLGLIPALAPRLRTHLVPWLAGGSRRMPLVADSDLGRAFALAAVAQGLGDYESLNICGAEFPKMREVIGFIASETGLPQPHYSVPYRLGYAFGWLMEKLNPLVPGYPFLTRSIVHLSEEWVADGEYARTTIGYQPEKDWRAAVREHLADLAEEGYPWPHLRQAV